MRTSADDAPSAGVESPRVHALFWFAATRPAPRWRRGALLRASGRGGEARVVGAGARRRELGAVYDCARVRVLPATAYRDLGDADAALELATVEVFDRLVAAPRRCPRRCTAWRSPPAGWSHPSGGGGARPAGRRAHRRRDCRSAGDQPPRPSPGRCPAAARAPGVASVHTSIIGAWPSVPRGAATGFPVSWVDVILLSLKSARPLDAHGLLRPAVLVVGDLLAVPSPAGRLNRGEVPIAAMW